MPQPRRLAFTLIELLIVVAIIAILAAIAIPNFLEAQTRSKVVRSLSDFRTLKNGLEAYRVDNNGYPEGDDGFLQLPRYASIFRVTTPVAYLTTIPTSPWLESFGTINVDNPKIATTLRTYLYVRKTTPAGTPSNDYENDRLLYDYQNQTPSDLSILDRGEWGLKSVGPDNLDDRFVDNAPGGVPSNARLYDPTNGTISRGDLFTFNDIGLSLR